MRSTDVVLMASPVNDSRRLALEGAKTFLETLEASIGAIADVNDFIAEHGLNGLMDVRSAFIECSLEVGHGGEVELMIEVAFMRREPTEARLAFSFFDPLSGAEQLAEQLVQS